MSVTTILASTQMTADSFKTFYAVDQMVGKWNTGNPNILVYVNHKNTRTGGFTDGYVDFDVVVLSHLEESIVDAALESESEMNKIVHAISMYMIGIRIGRERSKGS